MQSTYFPLRQKEVIKNTHVLEFEGGKGMMGEKLGCSLGDHLFQTLTLTCVCWWALVLYESHRNIFYFLSQEHKFCAVKKVFSVG